MAMSGVSRLCRCILKYNSPDIDRFSTCAVLFSRIRFIPSNLPKDDTLFDPPPPEEFTDVEVSRKEFVSVERLLPKQTIPEPLIKSYSTPSGWFPPADDIPNLPYYIDRTKNYMYPVYLEIKNANSRKLTKIKRIYGDIWSLEADLRSYLEEKTGKQVLTQVHEVARFLRIKGDHLQNVSQFLQEKGF